jgi:hypothetical protein
MHAPAWHPIRAMYQPGNCNNNNITTATLNAVGGGRPLVVRICGVALVQQLC